MRRHGLHPRHILYIDCDRTAFAAAVSDIRTLFRRAEFPIAGPSARPGTTPVLDADFIGFNGVNQNCVCDPDYHGLDVGWYCDSGLVLGPWCLDSDRRSSFDDWTMV